MRRISTCLTSAKFSWCCCLNIEGCWNDFTSTLWESSFKKRDSRTFQWRSWTLLISFLVSKIYICYNHHPYYYYLYIAWLLPWPQWLLQRWSTSDLCASASTVSLFLICLWPPASPVLEEDRSIRLLVLRLRCTAVFLLSQALDGLVLEVIL